MPTGNPFVAFLTMYARTMRSIYVPLDVVQSSWRTSRLGGHSIEFPKSTGYFHCFTGKGTVPGIEDFQDVIWQMSSLGISSRIEGTNSEQWKQLHGERHVRNHERRTTGLELFFRSATRDTQ